MHRYYQEQYQLDGGQQDRYVTGSDAVGLTMGHYDTTAAADLPVPALRTAHPRYAIADNFFQAAFGGSFLNHQWLIAAATPNWPGAVNDGSATTCTRSSTRTGCRRSYPLYATPTGPRSTGLTAPARPGRAAAPARA